MSSELKKVSAGGKFFGSIVLLLGFALLFWVFALLAPAWRYFSPVEKNLDEKRAEARVAKREALEKDNEQKLTTYAWVNKDKDIVQIPIDKAMELVVGELNAKPVQPSAEKLEHPYPYGLGTFTYAPVAPAASGSATPAASGTAASGSAAPAPAASGSAAPAPATSGSTTAPTAATPAPQ